MLKLTNLRSVRGTESVHDLAKRSGLNTWVIDQTELGASIRPHEADRLALALNTDLATLGAVSTIPGA